MANVKYKKPVKGMARMVVKSENESRPSIGLTEVKGEIYYLSPDLIIPYKNQARRDINETGLQELMSSIRSQGIIQPLQVLNSQEYEGKFEVVSGERRLRAAKMLNLETIPCMILNRDRDANEIALIENIQREDLHPIELADAITKLLEDNKHGNQIELANRIGMSKQQISHLMAISRLPEDVKEHFIKNENININSLKKIAYMKDAKDIREIVFGTSVSEKKYKSIIRISSNGDMIRFDQLKLEKMTPTEKKQLRKELNQLISSLDI